MRAEGQDEGDELFWNKVTQSHLVSTVCRVYIKTGLRGCRHMMFFLQVLPEVITPQKVGAMVDALGSDAVSAGTNAASDVVGIMCHLESLVEQVIIMLHYIYNYTIILSSVVEQVPLLLLLYPWWRTFHIISFCVLLCCVVSHYRVLQQHKSSSSGTVQHEQMADALSAVLLAVSLNPKVLRYNI